MDDLALRTMHVFASKALTRIVEECGRRPSALRTACLDVLERAKEGPPPGGAEPSDEPASPDAPRDEPRAPSDGAREGVALLYFPALRLACESGSPRIMEAGLSSLQKLLAYGFVTAAMPAPTSTAASTSLSAAIVEVVCACKDEEDEAVQLQVVKAALTAVTAPAAGVHDTVLLLAVKSCYHLHLVGASALIRATALGGLNQMLHMVYSRVEFAHTPPRPEPAGALAADDSAPTTPQPARRPAAHAAAGAATAPPPAGAARGGEDGLGSVSVAQRDAFLVLRALCKLSMKPLPDGEASADGGGSHGDDSIDLRSKLLSLSLLVSILSSESGLKFRRGERFIAAVKQYLCLSLLKNGACPRPAVLQLSLRLFATLLSHFRDHLKSEIGVVFSNIFLLLLESPNATSAQKGLTLAALRGLLGQPQLVVDLFVNYDCDVEGASLFSRIAADLAKLAQLAPDGAEPGGPAEGHTADELRLAAVRALVAIVHSLSRWAARAGEPAGALTNGGGGGAGSEAGDEAEPVGREPSECAASDGGGLAPSGSVGALSTCVAPSQFAAALAYKRQLQHGIALFNLKPKKGLEYLKASAHLAWSAQGVAAFLQATPGLDKTEVGGYLGEHYEWNKSVLYAYVDGLDFTGMHFDDGIRHFLSGFRLPGEAQKIDRMMEKFAQRFCECNPGVFQSADTAYVLAYSLIMLNTDAHSAQIKAKMTAAEFVRNNRGINGADDLPADFLLSLYARIVGNEIKMKDEAADEPAAALGGASGRRRREALYAVEVARSVQRSQAAFKAAAGKASTYLSSDDAETVVPMFQQLWGPLLAGLSVFLEEADRARGGGADEAAGGGGGGGGGEADEEARVALLGFGHALHLACSFGLSTERDAFLAALVKLTALGTGERLRARHVDAMRVLVGLALHDGNCLGAGWAPVLKCVSEMQRLSMAAQGARSDADALGEGLGRGGAGGAVVSASAMAQWGQLAAPHIVQQTRLSAAAKAGGADAGASAAAAAAHAEAEAANAALVHTALSDPAFLALPGLPAQPDAALAVAGAGGGPPGAPGWVPEGSGGHLALDRIFSASAALDADAVVDFVVRLCAVSAEELLCPDGPRIFSLQKIVEVAYYNMGRIRLVWARIWTVLGGHFAAVGCHPHLGVGMYAVDALRQLAHTFLERDEHALYAFQAAFLRPFASVMAAHASPPMRELVVSCVRALAQRKGGALRSGWHPLLAVLAAAAADMEAPLVELGWAVLAEIAAPPPAGHLPSVCEGAAYLRAVGTVAAYAAQAESEHASTAAIALLGTSLPAQIASGTLALSGGAAGAEPAEEHPLAAALHQMGAAGGAAGAECCGGAESAAARVLRRPTVLGQLERGAEGAEGGGAGADAPEPQPAHQRPLRLPLLSSLLPPPSVLALSAPAAAAAADGAPDAHGAAGLRDALWWPLIAALAHCATDARPHTREAAVGALFGLCARHAAELAPASWAALLSELLEPLFSAPLSMEADGAPSGTAGGGEAVEAGAGAERAPAQAEAGGGAPGAAKPLAAADATPGARAAAAAAAAAAHGAWVGSTGVAIVQRLGALLVADGRRLAFLLPDVTAFLLQRLRSQHVLLVHAAAECLAALLVACTPDLPAASWAAVVDALRAAVVRSRAADGQGGGGGASDTLPGGLRAFLLRCCADVVQGLRQSLSPQTLLALLGLLAEESGRAQEARAASLLRCGSGGVRASSVQLEAATRLCAAELSAVGCYWAALLSLYLPHDDASGGGSARQGGRERQRAEQQAALLNTACGLDGRIRALLDGSLPPFVAYCSAAVAPRAPAQPSSAPPGAVAASAGAPPPPAAACQPDGARLAAGLLSPLIAQLLRGILAMTQSQFVFHLPRLYAPLVGLMGCEDRTVRALVHDVFEQRADVFVGHAGAAH